MLQDLARIPPICVSGYVPTRYQYYELCRPRALRRGIRSAGAVSCVPVDKFQGFSAISGRS